MFDFVFLAQKGQRTLPLNVCFLLIYCKLVSPHSTQTVTTPSLSHASAVTDMTANTRMVFDLEKLH